MMLQDLIDYCLSKKNSVIAFPFGDIPVCVKFNGHIFAEIYPGDSDYKITLRCHPAMGEGYRRKYPGIVLPGYHVPMRQRKYKNTVLLKNGIPESVIRDMIDHSYSTLTEKSGRK
jgi:predicted DNA-binding protein (MmcQ/YjbR family)